MSYVTKEREIILRQALETLQANTPITSIGPGAVARAIAEVVTGELADFYSIMEFNTAMNVISTARGRALELMGVLYNVERKQLTDLATIDATSGAFYFYLDSPHSADIVIPTGTRVFTDTDTYVGEQFSYTTASPALLAAGRTRVYVTLRPAFTDSVFTSGANTLVRHNLDTGNVVLRCTNPKPIAPQVGYETDDNLRTRIIKAARVAAGGTSEAMRFAALSIVGVRDLVVRSTPYGLGSVEALVVPEDRATAGAVFTQVSQRLAGVKPAGIRLFMKQPNYVPVDVAATIILRQDANVDPDGPARRAEVGIARFLNRHLPSGTMVYNRLVQSIFDASDAVNDVVITSLNVNGSEILRRNYTPEPDEQLVSGTIRVASA